MHTFIEICEEQERLRLLRHNEAEKLAYERMLDRKVTMPALPPTRGVYRDDISPAGERWYKVVTSQGKIGTIHLPIELCDPELEENLWRRLDAKDPARHLKAI